MPQRYDRPPTRARLDDKPTMNLEPACVNAAPPDLTTTAPALGLQRCRDDQPPVNRVQQAQAATHRKREGCTRRRGYLAILVVT